MQLPYVIDLEASGLGRGSYPIEVGFISPKGKGFCTLIKPIPAWTHWDPSAEQLHHISQATLDDHGKDLAYVASQLNEQLEGEVVYSDGWANDMCWLGLLFNEAEQPQKFRIESILTLLNEHEREQWSDVHKQVVDSTPLMRHRASSDALMIQKTFGIIKSASESGINPLSKMKIS